MNIQPISVNNNYKNNFSNRTVSGNAPANSSSPSFKGKGDPGKVTKFFAKYYGKWIADSDKVRKFSEKLSKMDKGDVARHFQVLGSVITSAAYMHSTLKNKDMDKDNALTLAVNQGLNFLIPTVAAYTIDIVIRNLIKQLEYKYSAIQETKISTLAKDTRKTAERQLSRQLKGFRTLAGILTFTMIYRFITPVVITPVANSIGRKINEHKAAKKAQSAEPKFKVQTEKKS